MAFGVKVVEEEKGMPDVSGYNGMQKLFYLDCMDTKKEVKIINYHLANHWKVIDMKIKDSEGFILLEYSDDNK